MSSKLYSEIFADFDKAETRADKIAVLRKYDHPRFREFLYYVFSDDIKFDVEIPSYKPALEPEGMNMSNIHLEVPKLYRFITNHPKRTPGLFGVKQRNLFTGILESVHKTEAELLVKMVKKDLGIKYLTKQIVKEAFPGINI
jgi:hypothetical protein